MDRAIQVFGAEGMSQDQLLAEAYAQSRTLRIADGPDEVHLLYDPLESFSKDSQLGRYEAKKGDQERKNILAMKKKQLELLQSKGYKARL